MTSPTNKDEQNFENKEISIYEKWNETLDIIKEKTGFRGGIVVASIIIGIAFVYIGFMERFITNMIGTIYPVFCTIETLEYHTGDDKYWLTYWVVFGIFTLVDMFSGFILKIVPFYFFIKILFLVWCFMPNTQGAVIMYNFFISRFFEGFEKNIEIATQELKSDFNGILKREEEERKKQYSGNKKIN